MHDRGLHRRCHVHAALPGSSVHLNWRAERKPTWRTLVTKPGRQQNSAFWAWAELEYNCRIHSSTGQAPDERFQQGLPKEHRRVEDLAAFQAMFLWKDRRTVTKWGKISLYSNQYPVRTRAPGAVVQVRYDPFDLREILIYDLKSCTRLETTSASKQVATRAPSMPEEAHNAAPQISAQSVAYFTRLREQYFRTQKRGQEISFQKLRDPATEDPHA